MFILQSLPKLGWNSSDCFESFSPLNRGSNKGLEVIADGWNSGYTKAASYVISSLNNEITASIFADWINCVNFEQ